MTSHDQAVSKDAKALRRAAGHDPYGDSIGEVDAIRTGEIAIQAAGKTVPNWHHFLKEASKFLEALKAEGGHVGNG
ncbi:hypothetical protein [Taklimakanibacter deserti]|uniref:hypothetical protein n=1 Tax=Taklimakanibacter deserti TaxID=2267839 RepID=UPI0013C465EA